MKNVLRTEKLTRILPNEIPVTLVQDIDITIGQSEFVAIMGPSGSGNRRCCICLVCWIRLLPANYGWM